MGLSSLLCTIWPSGSNKTSLSSPPPYEAATRTKPKRRIASQSWHLYDYDAQKWVPVPLACCPSIDTYLDEKSCLKAGDEDDATLIDEQIESLCNKEADGVDVLPAYKDVDPEVKIICWSLRAALTYARATVVVDYATRLHHGIDAMFFSQTSRGALDAILDNKHLRAGWYSSESEDPSAAEGPLISVTLLSKASFQPPKRSAGPSSKAAVVWKTIYRLPSRMPQPDALLPVSKYGGHVIPVGIVAAADDARRFEYAQRFVRRKHRVVNKGVTSWGIEAGFPVN